MTDLTERAVASRVPSIAGEKIRLIARRDPLTVTPGTSLRDCVTRIRETGTGDSVFVVDTDHHLLGVLTERDIFANLVGRDVDVDQPVDGLMNRQPRTLRLEQLVRDAIDLMQTGRYRNVPLIDDDGVLVGVIRPVDVLQYLAEAFPEELLNLPPRPHQLMAEPEGA